LTVFVSKKLFIVGRSLLVVHCSLKCFDMIIVVVSTFFRRFSACLLALYAVCECSVLLFAQVEHVPVVHPVYDFLVHAEARGVLKYTSTSALPLQRKEIVQALREMRLRDTLLSAAEQTTLTLYEREFRIQRAPRAVVFATPSDSIQLLFDRIATNDEKFISFYTDSTTSVSILPLLSADVRVLQGGTSNRAVLGTYGGRIFGTIDNAVGFFVQGTSGVRFLGEQAFLLEDPTLRTNPTLRLYNPSFFNFTESHVRYDRDWFYASIGRETRLIGAGYRSRGIMADNAPPTDAFTLGGRFPTKDGVFEYRFMHFSLSAEPLDLNGNINPRSAGVGTVVVPKFMAYHRASVRGAWGEASIWETMIYNGRGVELAYLNPFSFLKTVGDYQRDRDNSALGVDVTVRVLPGVQFKGTFLLDDADFGKLGQGWWQNKIAWNLGLMLSPVQSPFDASLEYTLASPYAYTHFDRQNALTQDGYLFAGKLQPNSDELSAQLRYWWGGRYPITLTGAYRRHGRNGYDARGNLVNNVGGDVLQTIRRDSATGAYTDSPTVAFLDGDRDDRLTLTLQAGFEIVRHVNLQVLYRFTSMPLTDGATLTTRTNTHFFGLVIRFEDF
jgi:hypothetical protein